MKKVLIVETNTDRYDSHSIKTGLWLGELIHFYEEIKKVGWEADFVSPKGGEVPIDPTSLRFLTKIDQKWMKDEAFKQRALYQTKRPEEINPKDYIAIYYTGGHGVLWDFPDNKVIQQIAEEIYHNKGYITGVCHGVVGMLNIKDEEGNYLIAGKKVTGFTDTEEWLSGKRKKVPFSTEKALKKRQGIYQKKRFFKSYAIGDGQIITGQNPWSPKAVATLLIAKVGGGQNEA